MVYFVGNRGDKSERLLLLYIAPDLLKTVEMMRHSLFGH